MNLRQAQRSLADLVTKCEAANINLPKDPLEARAEAVEAIMHSKQNGKINLKYAQDMLQQKFGLGCESKQRIKNDEAKRLLRFHSHKKKVKSGGDVEQSLKEENSSSIRQRALTVSKRSAIGQDQDVFAVKASNDVNDALQILQGDVVSVTEKGRLSAERRDASEFAKNMMGDHNYGCIGQGEPTLFETYDLDGQNNNGSGNSDD